VFFSLKCIEFNLIEKHVITFKFSKDNSINFSTFLAQQQRGQLNKTTPRNTKGAKHELNVVSSSNSLE
jgi:hypothetical protein